MSPFHHHHPTTTTTTTTLPPPPPPPPPPPIPPPAGAVDHPHGGHDWWYVPGGYIKFTGTSLNAHCTNPAHACKKNPCRLNRTNQPSAIAGGCAGQGRPLGLLLAWLRSSNHYPDMPTHKKSAVKKHKVTLEDQYFTSLAVRQECRRWLLAEGPPALREGKERPKLHVHEPDEPIEIH